MKKFVITEEEKNRILGMYKRHLNEDELAGETTDEGGKSKSSNKIRTVNGVTYDFGDPNNRQQYYNILKRGGIPDIWFTRKYDEEYINSHTSNTFGSEDIWDIGETLWNRLTRGEIAFNPKKNEIVDLNAKGLGDMIKRG